MCIRDRHKDVLDLADVLRGAKGGAFGQVHARTYVDEQVTVDAIRKAKDFLRDSKIDDTVVLFVAGHGTHARDAAAEFYYVTHDTDVHNLAKTAANFALVESLLQDIAPRRKLFLMDTCESGERDDDVGVHSTGAGQRGLRTRGLFLDTTPSATGTSPARPYLAANRDRYIYNDLLRRSGAIVLSSSRGNEVSFERDDIKNGVFTEEILKALVSDVADRDKDGVVTTDELREYLAGAVAASTTDKQHPVVDRDNLDARFGLPIVRAAAAIVTR